jgi:hypothetical protein
VEHSTRGTVAYVDLGRVEVEDLLGSSNNDGEGLVDLEEGDVLHLDASVLESHGDGDGRGDGEVDGSDGGVGET